jgi:hypothetical protein
MTEAEGFLAHLGRTLKANPALSKSDETKVTVSVSVKAITSLIQPFYAQGYKDGVGSGSIFENIFGKPFGK